MAEIRDLILLLHLLKNVLYVSQHCCRRCRPLQAYVSLQPQPLGGLGGAVAWAVKLLGVAAEGCPATGMPQSCPLLPRPPAGCH